MGNRPQPVIPAAPQSPPDYNSPLVRGILHGTLYTELRKIIIFNYNIDIYAVSLEGRLCGDFPALHTLQQILGPIKRKNTSEHIALCTGNERLAYRATCQ